MRRLLLLVLAIATGSAWAQDLGTLDPKPLPPLANPNDPTLPARELFGRKTDPVSMPPRSIGFYSKGCHRGCRCAADQWRDVAGHAALAQPKLGQSPLD